MPKLKMARKSTNIDMTAMCDVAFLLLTFFMLATKFKPDEPVVVKTPSSISEIPLPDTDIMLLTVDPKGRIFFSIDNVKMRKELIDVVDEYKNLGLTQAEKDRFTIGSSVGVPFRQLKSYLAMDPLQAKEMDKTAPGVPADTALTDANDLAAWVRSARTVNAKLRLCIKADGEASYPSVEKVIGTLESLKIFKFNLITNLREVPKGTAAFEAKNAPASAPAAQ